MAKGAKAAALSEADAAKMVEAFLKATPECYSYKYFEKTKELKAILGLDAAATGVIVKVLADRVGDIQRRRMVNGYSADGNKPWIKEQGMMQSLLLSRVLVKKTVLDSATMLALLQSVDTRMLCLYEPGCVGAFERYVNTESVSEEMRETVKCVAARMAEGDVAKQKLSDRLMKALSVEKSEGTDGKVESNGSRSATKDEKRAEVNARALSAMERALLGRETAKEPPAVMVDAYAAAVKERAIEGTFDTGMFDDVVAAPGVYVDRAFLRVIDGMFTDAPDRMASNTDERIEPAFGKATPEQVAIGCACAVGVSVRVKHGQVWSNPKLSNGFERLIRHVEFGVAEMKKIDVRVLSVICMTLSKWRKQEYLYLDLRQIADKLVELAADLQSELDEEACAALIRFRERIAHDDYAPSRSGVRKFDRQFGIAQEFPFELGERWADRAFQDVVALPEAVREVWVKLLTACSETKGATPTAKWLKQIDGLVAELPAGEFERRVSAWLPLVGKTRVQIPGGKVPGRDATIPSDTSAEVLRGVAFVCARFDTPEMARNLGDLAMVCFKMVPGHGARCIKPGSSALWSLAQMTTPSALGQLSRLRQLVKFGTAKKMLDVSLEKLAAKLGMTTEELHEVAAPDFGLSKEGTLEEEAGEYTLRMVVDPHGATIRVLDEESKERKTMPESVKKEHGETLKALKQAKDDVEKMLEAQRARIDALFIADRTWTVTAWRERYIDHALVGVLGRRLIWKIVENPKKPEAGRSVMYRPGLAAFADVEGKACDIAEGAHLKLWHPIEASGEDVRRWREVVEREGLRQPVKQAHREVYPLTDAERGTGTYSNRYAAHIVKQHAFQQLAAERSWTSKLRLMVDAEYPPPLRVLSGWALRAEFWVDSLGDEYGEHTTDSGSYLYLTTDQVRFYRQGAAQAYVHAGGGDRYTAYGADRPENHPLRLEDVPALVFSEIMRDVDLFVAGASVGNNAEWQDGGPEGHFRDYWASYSFGALTASGTARKEFLQSLIPRLRIAPQCSFDGNYLVVKGTMRTYRIHLGSGNILMAPNDQYLCIVPSASMQANDGVGGSYLPFDGDRTLSLILSKALMLAEDAKIKDSSILSQIRRG